MPQHPGNPSYLTFVVSNDKSVVFCRQPAQPDAAAASQPQEIAYSLLPFMEIDPGPPPADGSSRPGALSLVGVLPSSWAMVCKGQTPGSEEITYSTGVSDEED